MKKVLVNNWPTYAAIGVFLLVLWLTLRVSIQQNHGNLIYAADDAYIGMAVARNFACYGVWGVTRYGFTSSSSTLLWTLLLAGTDYLGGMEQIGPLLWNVIFALLLLVTAGAILSYYKVSQRASFIALLGLIFLLPLPTLVLLGMEHTLQTLLTVLTVFLAARVASNEYPGATRRDAILLLFLAPMVTSTRFEGAFLVAATAGMFLLVKRWRLALGFGFCGTLPLFAHAVISISKGWFWLPASVLLKASLPNSGSGLGFLLSLVNPIVINFHEGLHTLVLLVAVLLVYVLAGGRGSSSTESRQLMGALLVVLWIAHLEFVGGSSLYRYDAHLCALSLLFLATQLPVFTPRLPSLVSASTWQSARNLACGVLALVLFLPLAVKGGRLLWFLPQCTTNIFEQQYQMGLFVRKYYQGSTVALNDIGAVNYLADIHCLDLMGLANPEVARARRRGNYQLEDIRRLAKETGTRIAIIYDIWFQGKLPPEWIRVGRWTIPNNVVAGGDTVSFYAVDPSEGPHLAESLTDFSSQLPPDVYQQGK